MVIQTLENFAFQKGAPLGIRYIARPDVAALPAAFGPLVAQIQREFQLAPPVTLHASAPDFLAAYWHGAREAYVVGKAQRALREVVAATVSSLNACPYCVTVHTGMFRATGAGDLADEARQTSEMRAARRWAAATLSPGSAALSGPDLPAALIPQVFGTAVMFHYTNRMVSLFLDDSPVPLPGMSSRLGSRIVRRALAVLGGRIARHDPEPGKAAMKTAATLPAAFRWAIPDPAVADALADFARAAEAAGAAALPAEVRALVIEHLSRWQGETPPMSRAWLDGATDTLSESQRPAARFALLVARAPWQIDPALVAAFRAAAPGDGALVQAAGWAAYVAASQIASWFPQDY